MTDLQPTKKPEQQSVWTPLVLAGELGLIIAIPVVVLAFGGAWLDKQYGTSPLLLISGCIIAFLLSAIAVVRKVRGVIRP